MQNEGSQDRWLVLHRAGVGAGLIGEFVDIKERRIGQGIVLEVSPEVFDRIELGCIGRQVFGSDMGLGREEHLDNAGAVRLQPIPDQDPGRAELTVELAEERADGDGVEIGMWMESEIKLHSIARGRHTEGGNDRDLLVRPSPLLEDGRDAARMPGPSYQRRHQKARLVDEDEIGAQARGVFFTRGQSVLAHCLMAASSRSTARRVGFCGLHPMPRSSRPM